MKLALAQLDPTVEALSHDVARMQTWVAHGHSHGADRVLFPELSLVGYPPRDLVGRQSFAEAVLARTGELVRSVRAGLTVVFGTLGRASGRGGPRIVRQVQRAEYTRRQAAPGLIVTRKAFGPGRRMPVARGYEEEAR
jgi:predicted amidohydrolase